MTPEEADKAQSWAGMDGVTAWHLIERHADDWHEIGAMMDAWLRANVLAEREACALIADDYDPSDDSSMCEVAEGIAAEIRARNIESY